MITKTEQNLTANMPASRAPLSIKSIIKDLQDLDKSLVTENEVEAMMTKMQKLEDENSRIKTEMEAMEADRKLYYNQFHQNVKELNELKVENEFLKAEISSLKKTEDFFSEESNIAANVCSTFQSRNFGSVFISLAIKFDSIQWKSYPIPLKFIQKESSCVINVHILRLSLRNSENTNENMNEHTIRNSKSKEQRYVSTVILFFRGTIWPTTISFITDF